MRQTSWSAALIALGLTLLGMAEVATIYLSVETRRVPVERLVRNLEGKLKEDPQNVRAHINLARLHGMAYALKSDTLPATGGPSEKDQEPWYGRDPKLIPYENRPAPTTEADAAARVHLQKALSHYSTALTLDSFNLLARLGYGWALQQSGEREKAIDQYRRVVAAAWPIEQEKRSRSLGDNFFTREAIDYLLPLLDPQKDGREIAELRERAATLDRLPRAITPIAIPLTDALPPSAIHDYDARIRFDADGSGASREWSWLGPDAAWLVYDADGSGEITSALQLFGNVTFWLFWNNGYEALSSLDDNRDGAIAGTEADRLGLWHDRNRNGVSDRGEVRALLTYGIVNLSCRFEEGDGIRFAAVSTEGVRFANGRTRPTYDVILRSGGSLTLAGAPRPDDIILHDRAREHE